MYVYFALPTAGKTRLKQYSRKKFDQLMEPVFADETYEVRDLMKEPTRWEILQVLFKVENKQHALILRKKVEAALARVKAKPLYFDFVDKPELTMKDFVLPGYKPRAQAAYDRARARNLNNNDYRPPQQDNTRLKRFSEF
jgi:hypothetical protein